MNPNRKLPRFHLSSLLVAVAAFTVVGLPALAQQPGASPVKIYLMIGQSNMQGQGRVSGLTTPGTLEYTVANEPGTYGFLKDGGGNWVVRDDVWIHFERSPITLKTGGLTRGYGSSDSLVGPEIGFGHAIGDAQANQVLLIKTAWGGKSLGNDFLPPSSGPYPAPRVPGDAGFYYAEILRLVDDAITNLAAYFPNYNGQGYEIAGLCFHQGWNDQYGGLDADYETNLVNFINDIRSKDKGIGVPGLPIVIASSGMISGASLIKDGQLAMDDAGTYPEFVGNVAVIDTEQTYTPLGLDFMQTVANSPVNQSFHWNQNAKTYTNIGLAMAHEMPLLTAPRCPSRLRATGTASGVVLSWQNGSETVTSVQILRDGVEIAAAAPVTPTVYTDTTVEPGEHSYQLVFTMPGDPCDPLTVTHDSGISGLSAYRSQNGVMLNWGNNLGYAAIEVRRGGVVIEPALSGSATSYEDTGAPASGLVTYSVVPTSGTSTPAEVQVNLGPVIAGYASIYEPFDLPAGSPLDGGAGGPGLGAWSGGGTLGSGGMTFGSLPATGNQFTGGGNVTSWAGISTTLSSAGLLDHGAELWFSVLLQPGSAANDYGFLGLSSVTGNIGANFNSVPAGANVIGVWLQNGSDLQLVDAVDGTPVGGRDGVKGDLSLDVPTLVVGKFTWGADGASPDTLAIYLPGIDLVQPASNTGATLTTVIDQSTFSHLGVWMTNANSLADEIRFGSSYDDVIGAGLDTADDLTPPTPAQMGWASPPTTVSDTAISMTAVTASDDNGVEYQFTRYLGAVVDATSPWQSSPAYTATGLSPSTTYAYTVQARDRSVNQNTNTASSPAAEATTFAEDTTPPPVPSLVTPLGPVTATEITVSANPVADGEGNDVEYRFHNTTLGSDSGWLTDPAWTETGLTPETTYSYTVQARDTSANQNESVASSPESATTLAPGGSGAAVFYEPFDYSAVGLVAVSDWTSVSNGDNLVVQAGGLSYGTLPVSGAHLAPSGGAGVTLNSVATTLAGAGLLNDGATLWMSVVVQPQATSNANTTIQLGTNFVDPFSAITGGTVSGNDSLGVHLQNGQDIQARYHHDGALTNSGNVKNNASLLETHLVVVEMIWNADNALADTLNYYLPDANLNQGSAIKTVNTATFNQSTFDNFSLAVNSSSSALVDEIRFGSSYDDVIGAGGSGTSDYDTWAGSYLPVDIGQPGDDHDNDGRTNDEERLWGLDPTSPASVNPISVPFDPAAGTFTYQRRDPALSGATFSYEYSPTLAPGSWQAFTPDPVTTDGESPVETVTVPLDAGLLANRTLFVRMVATAP